jgi:hypothetical protein
MRAAWTGRSFPLFAEAAEVLGVETDMVMAAVEIGRTVTVLYTPERSEAMKPEGIRGAGLRRGDDGVLVLVSGPARVAAVEEAFRELLDE